MPRMKSATISVKGLDEFRRELKKLDDAGLTDQLKDVNRKVADLVVDRAQGKASTRQERKAAASLRASRQAARAQVVGGNARVPWFTGAEFGAGQNAPRIGPSGRRFLGFNQFGSWTGNGRSAGNFLYPAIREATDEIVDMYGDAIEKIAARAFPDGGP